MTSSQNGTPRRVAPTRDAAPPSLGPVLDFLRLLWRLDHALQRRSKRMLAELGLTGPQRLVLRIVGRFPGIPAGELAALLHVHPSTLTGMLARLESGGWLARATDRSDRRRALFRLTARGRALERNGGATIESDLRHLLGGAARRDVVAAARVLRDLADALEPDEADS